MTATDQIKAVFAVILMLIVSYFVGVKLFELANLYNQGMLPWIYRLAVIAVLVTGNIIIPAMIAVGRKVNPINGLKGMGALFLTYPFQYAFMIPIWNFLEPLIENTGPIYLVAQLLGIMAIIITSFGIPLVLCLEES